MAPRCKQQSVDEIGTEPRRSQIRLSAKVTVITQESHNVILAMGHTVYMKILLWHLYPGGFTTIRTSIHVNLMTLLHESHMTSTTLMHCWGANHPHGWDDQLPVSRTNDILMTQRLIQPSDPEALCSYWTILPLNLPTFSVPEVCSLFEHWYPVWAHNKNFYTKDGTLPQLWSFT